MQQQELNDLMRESAGDAVVATKEEFSIELDYSSESISHIDDILLGFVAKYHDKALEDKMVFTLCNIYGAYVGEVFKKNAGGEWHYDDTDPKAPFIVLSYNNNTYAFASICYERLVNDSAVSVKNYFELALSNHRQ